MVNEETTNELIRTLLKEAKITPTAQGTNDKIIAKTLKDASKKDTGKKGAPDLVAFSNSFPLIFENKKDIKDQAEYLNESKTKLKEDTTSKGQYAENGALHYAKHIVNHKDNPSYEEVFAFGCSGDKDNYIIRPIFVNKEGYKLLPYIYNFENFKEDNIEKYYKEQVLGETPPEILELEEIIKKAKELNACMREEGSLGKKEKSLVVSAILLALNNNENIRYELQGKDNPKDGEKLYNEITYCLKSLNVPQNKQEVLLNQFNFIKTNATLNNKKEIEHADNKRTHETNGKKEDYYLNITPLKFFTDFIYKYIYESVKHNKQEDVLAKFYQEFVSYEGGEDKKDFGIVLTPTHITDLFCDLVDLQYEDTVLDPCCGTGSFLLSAMNKMINKVKLEAKDSNKNINVKEEIKKIKKNKLYGVEIREEMFSIATSNMILRGDGKSNLIRDDLFSLSIEELDINHFSLTKDTIKELSLDKDYKPELCSVGFMNPPYAQGKNNKKRSEIHFIQQLLNSLQKGGRAAVIVPISTMVGTNAQDREVKKKILEEHTLEGVITVNPDLFKEANVNNGTCIAVFKCHNPHPPEKYVKFIDFQDDGYVLKSKIGLVETERAKERKSLLLDCWLHGKKADSKFMIEHKVKHTDEWIYGYYAFNDEIPDISDFEKTISDYLTFEFARVLEGKKYLFENKELSDYNEKY